MRKDVGRLSPMPTPWASLFDNELPGLLSVWQGRKHHESQSLVLPRRVAAGVDEPGGPQFLISFQALCLWPQSSVLMLGFYLLSNF